MLRKLPGIDIPAAIDANILHAAAFLEFKQHVERLAREGHELAAYTCWMHALEIRHSLFVIPTTSESELFPPLVKMPCCKSDCFKFPGWGCGAAAASSFHPICSLWTLGPTTMSIRRRWTSFFWCTSTTTAKDLVPQDIYGLQLRCAAGDAGELGMGAWGSFPERRSGDPTRRVCWACCVGLCNSCFPWRHSRVQCGVRRKTLVDL